jgi:hypothetical protein
MNEYNFANAQAQAPVDANALMQAQANYSNLLANAAAQADGIELDFQGDECGESYRIERAAIGSTFRYWRCFFYDWHDGWLQINRWPGEKKRHDAIEICNQHAVQKRLIKFLPHRTKFKATGWGGIAAAASGAASIAGFTL